LAVWATTAQVAIQYSTDNTHWTNCLNANPLDFDNAIYGWDINAIAPGSNYLIRVTSLTDTTFTTPATLPSRFSITGRKQST